MARSRNIKHGFFKNEFLAQCSPHARLLFIGLWTLADRRGRLEDRPLRIKGELFALENVEVESLLQELAESEGNFITRYQIEGKRYIQIENFNRHQNPHHREGESLIPPYIPEKPQASPGLSPTKVVPSLGNSVPSRADSFNLIPDSLISESDANASVCVNENGLEKGNREKSLDPTNSLTDENKKLAEEGMLYLASLNSPNHTNIAWTKGYLGIQFQALETSRPDLPKQQILSVWRDVCDLAVSKNATAPQWLKTTFKNKLDSLTANEVKTPLPKANNGQAETLLKSPFIRHKVTGEIFPSHSLEYRPEAKGGLHHKDYPGFYPLAHLEGVEEALAHDA